MSTKEITFEGKAYIAPSFVAWVARDSDGTIRGFQYEPFQDNMGGGYYAMHGQECVLFSPKKCVVLKRV